MKRKKLLSTAVAGALVAAQMVMPVMATDGGQVDVDVTTRTAVIRVEVPTSLVIAVNQFEKEDTGSQIYSDTFNITNKSEIPVEVKVTSTASLDSSNPITLVSTKAAAEVSTDEEAWVAVAALTSAGKFIEDSGKGIKDLTEASENVTTFEQDAAATDTAKAVQTFYLGAEATPTVKYMIVDGTDATKLAAAKKISYAQFYEVNKETLTANSEQDELDALLAAGDVYMDDGTDVTPLAKGSSHNYNGETFYSVVLTGSATEPARVEVNSLTANKYYVYGEAGVGDKAGFRYIGKLSEGKTTWVAADIKRVNIKYDITGVTTTKYEELKDACTYGLYAAVTPAAPSITTTTYNYDRTADLPITVDLGAGNLSATDVQSVSWSATQNGTYADFAKGTKWTYSSGTLTLKSGTWGSGSVNDKKYLKVTFNDTDATEVILELTISK